MELATAAGLTQAAISQIEAGKRIPGSGTLKAIAKALGLRASTLLGEERDEKPREAWEEGFQEGLRAAQLAVAGLRSKGGDAQ